MSAENESDLSRLLRDVARAPAQEPPVDLTGRRVGRYLLVERIGRGGMGEVWRARDEKLARAVAVKLLVVRSSNGEGRESADDARARFLREGRAAAALAHPNICAVYDVDEADGVPFIAMELLGGSSLREVLARSSSQPMSQTEVREIALDVARALAAAHDAGVVHRDVKPENIRVLPDGRAKLLDFGLARVNAGATTPADVTEAKTATGVVLGTPRYMSPEQAEGKNVDARSDVFSFGVVLYEMLAGAWPWDVSSSAAVTAAILRDAPRPLPPDRVDRALADVVMRCLAKDPSARFANGQALARALADAQPRVMTTTARPKRSAASMAVVAVLAVFALVAVAIVWLRSDGGSTTALTHLHPVPSSERVTTGVALSRDGEWLATIERGIDGVVLQRVNGADRRVLPLASRAVSVAFAPDGSALLVADADGAALRVDVGTAAATKIADGSDAVDESADGRVLLSTTRELVVLEKDGQRHAVHLGQPLAMARWSPDGASVLYTDDSPLMSAATRGRILMASNKLSERRELAPNQDNVFAWLDDRTIAYPLDRALMALDVAPGSSPRELARFDDGAVLALATSPQARRLVLARGSRQEEVYVGALDEADADEDLAFTSFDRLTFNATDDYAHGWIDDDTVLISSTRNATYDVLAQDLGAPEPHTTPVLGARSADEWRTQPAVGPGGAILYWSVPSPARPESERTKATLMMRAPGASTSTPLRDVTITAQRHLGSVMLPDWRAGRVTCSPAACVLWRVSETRLEIEQLDVPGTTRKIEVTSVLLPAAHYGVVRLSPDGNLLAAYDGGATLQMVDTETSRTETLAVAGLGEMAFIDDDHMLLATEGVLSLLSLETREVKQLRRGPVFGRLFVSPDGERVAVTVREEKTELLVGELEH